MCDNYIRSSSTTPKQSTFGKPHTSFGVLFLAGVPGAIASSLIFAHARMGNKVSHHSGGATGSQGRNSFRGISPQERRERILASAQVLHRHLVSDQPIALPPDIRRCIAEETRHCWTKCKVCATYSSSHGTTREQPNCQTAKLKLQSRNGDKLFEDLRHAGHSFSDQLSFKVTGQASWPRVRNIGT